MFEKDTLWAKPQYKESARLADGHSKDTEVNVISKLASQTTIESLISCANISVSSGSKQVIYLTHSCRLEIWTGIGRCSSGLCSVWWTSAQLAYVSRGRVLSPGDGWPGMAFSGTCCLSCMWYLIFQTVWLELIPRVALQDCKGIGECSRPLEAQAWDWHGISSDELYVPKEVTRQWESRSEETDSVYLQELQSHTATGWVWGKE